MKYGDLQFVGPEAIQITSVAFPRQDIMDGTTVSFGSYVDGFERTRWYVRVQRTNDPLPHPHGVLHSGYSRSYVWHRFIEVVKQYSEIFGNPPGWTS